MKKKQKQMESYMMGILLALIAVVLIVGGYLLYDAFITKKAELGNEPIIVNI